jgi:DNA-damage-inducible protein J
MQGDDFMANTVNLNIRVDEDLKRRAEAIFNELGMNLSTAMNLFLRSAVRCRGIPFELRVEQHSADGLTADWTPEHWAKVREMLADAEADFAAGRESDAFGDLAELRGQYGL